MPASLLLAHFVIKILFSAIFSTPYSPSWHLPAIKNQDSFGNRPLKILGVKTPTGMGEGVKCEYKLVLCESDLCTFDVVGDNGDVFEVEGCVNLVHDIQGRWLKAGIQV